MNYSFGMQDPLTVQGRDEFAADDLALCQELLENASTSGAAGGGRADLGFTGERGMTFFGTVPGLESR